MAKHKDRPQQSNGGAGGGYQSPEGGWQQQPESHSASEPMTGVPPNTPQAVVGSPVGGPGLRLDVPTGRPPGFSAAPGAFVQPGGTSWQAPGYPPSPGWETPSGIEQLAVPLPIGEKATHFSGPIVSGGIPQNPLWRVPGSTPSEGPLPVAGTAVLTTTLTVDFSMGDFTIPVQFPEGSVLSMYGTTTLIGFDAAGPVAWSLKNAAGASLLNGSFLSAPNHAGPFAAGNMLPLWDAAPPEIPFQAQLNVNGNTPAGTQGLGLIMIQYIRIPQRWT